MIKIYGNCSKEVANAANDKLRDFIDFFYSLLNGGKDHENKVGVLNILFPPLIVNEKMGECMKAVEDLYQWSNDNFTHSLKPLHEYALYRILQELEEQFENEDGNIYNMTEYFLSDIDEDGQDEYTIEDTNTFYFYYCNCFLDFDFYWIDEYINSFEERGVKIFESLGLNLAEYKDLIPSDIIENNEELLDLINNSNEQPMELINLTKEQFFMHISKVINQFNHSIVNQSMYRLLWNDDGTPRKEKSSQDLFLNNLYSYCKNNGIDVSKEPNIGRGPVDFKLSHGTLKVLIEVKLASNSSFWQGMEVQTIQYMIQEDIKHAVFLVIVNYPEEMEIVKDIETKALELGKEYSIELLVEIVDSTLGKKSASKMKKGDISIYKPIG